jgi:hypothetical protein
MPHFQNVTMSNHRMSFPVPLSREKSFEGTRFNISRLLMVTISKQSLICKCHFLEVLYAKMPGL